ncbi:MAG: hypothetical protein IJM09_06915 [Neisseriaceae bacterium]|nr:hypothetical protein [Neisseriaceae bacterium]
MSDNTYFRPTDRQREIRLFCLDALVFWRTPHSVFRYAEQQGKNYTLNEITGELLALEEMGSVFSNGKKVDLPIDKEYCLYPQ